MKSKCKGCGVVVDLDTMSFIDYDEMPMVLDCQLSGTPTERKAINFVKRKHSIDPRDYEEDDGKLHMYHYEKAGKMSHDEPGADGHDLELPVTGYWSFE